MTATRRPRDAGDATSRDELIDRFRAEGLEPRWWSNGAGDVYGAHSHGYHKVLYCQSGSVVCVEASR